jgi:hypothetical protein
MRSFRVLRQTLNLLYRPKPFQQDPREVTLRFRGEMRSTYHPIGLDDPDSRFNDPRIVILSRRVFRSSESNACHESAATKSLGNETPLMRLRPLQGTTQDAARQSSSSLREPCKRQNPKTPSPKARPGGQCQLLS